ncbi:MAG TPA: helix-turn-helix domain-containing protein, partial [Pyrinomonadaceae bacterium]|nr:helix-turn-helix domain-containing protein [Pyrinomonadaceae bacterium]
MNSEPKTKLTKTAKGEQTKALILNSALDLLGERGYEATTMRAIAKQAGVSLGNAYHYFGSKEHL